MSRQIRFFMMSSDETQLFRVIKDQNDQMIDSRADVINTEYALKTKLRKLFIRSPESKIVMSSSGFLDMFESEVIEFTRSIEWQPGSLRNGRLFVESYSFDEFGQPVRKARWLDDKYKFYKKWLLQECKISKDKAFYICREALKAYEDRGYKMLGSPKYEVEFE